MLGPGLGRGVIWLLAFGGVSGDLRGRFEPGDSYQKERVKSGGRGGRGGVSSLELSPVRCLFESINSNRLFPLSRFQIFGQSPGRARCGRWERSHCVGQGLQLTIGQSSDHRYLPRYEGLAVSV